MKASNALFLGLMALVSVAQAKAPATRPATEKVLAQLLGSTELSQYIATSNLPLKDAELTSTNLQVDGNGMQYTYTIDFEYTKYGGRDVTCNFTATILFDACNGAAGKLMPAVFSDLGCSE